MDIQQKNFYVMSLMSRFLNEAPTCIDASVVNELASACGIPIDEAYTYLLAIYCGVDLEGDGRDIFEEYFRKMIREMKPDEFLSNPYYKNISFPNVSSASIELCHCQFKAFEAFVFDDICIRTDGRIIPQIGFFSEEISYPAIMENGRIWMTVTPMEINTIRPAVERAHGKVLAYGLGIGYFAYMAAAKDDVDSVTVIELNKDIIELFVTHILPQFGDAAKKITIVNADAFDYAEKEMGEGRFDFVFTDLWHDVSDGEEMYYRMKAYESLSPNSEFMYWIEKSILGHISLLSE